ncbi:MAG TPA: TIGR03936 family radical SAM-associated protein, partial [Gemmatimonadales bacterium]
SVKLYFMIGHPTENEADFAELADLVGKIKRILAGHTGRRHITLGFSPFVPKSHTPFQWERQDSFEVTRTKLAWVKERLRGHGVDVRHHETADTAVEGLISRGGREIADVIEGAWRHGARFDGWGEHCELSRWEGALAEVGLTLADTFREIGEDEELPWEIVSYKIDRDYFLKERHKAYAAGETEECKHERCSACGVCDFQAMHNVLAPEVTLPEPAAAPALRQGIPGTTVRLGYAKGERLRFISHLDLMREMERTFRRADLPMLYSEGFAPRPRISAGPPLALGWTSASEWLDVVLEGSWDEDRLTGLLEQLSGVAAAGLTFRCAGAMRPDVVSLTASMALSTYIATFPAPPFAVTLGELETAVARFLAQPAVMVTRERKQRTRTMDIRPLVHEMAVVGGAQVLLVVATGSDGSVKPTEVLQAALGLTDAQTPLIQIHKASAVLTAGESPLAGAVARAEGEPLETRNSYHREPAGNPCGDPGG